MMNPNPDRASRHRAAGALDSAKPAAGAMPEEHVIEVRDGEDESDDELGDHPAGAAAAAAQGDNVAATTTTKQQKQAQLIFGKAPARATGLNSIVPTRTPEAPKRSYSKTHPVWKLVEQLGQDHGGKLRCMLCNAVFAGGAARATEHVLGPSHPPMSQDATSDEAKNVAAVKNYISEFNAKKQQKAVHSAVNQASSEFVVRSQHGSVSAECNAGGQRTLPSVLSCVTADITDKAIARFFYACSIPAACAEHPEFKSMATALMCAPTSYRPPGRLPLYGKLLDATVYDLRVQEAPLRKAILENGGTVCSDGWDTVQRDHLINMLVGTFKGMFFDGTIELDSNDHENADQVAEFLRQFIERTGRLGVVQIVTDTCSVMKAAWKVLENHYKWLTATCCGTHVLSLELKDFAKIDVIATVIRKATPPRAPPHFSNHLLA